MFDLLHQMGGGEQRNRMGSAEQDNTELHCASNEDLIVMYSELLLGMLAVIQQRLS